MCACGLFSLCHYQKTVPIIPELFDLFCATVDGQRCCCCCAGSGTGSEVEGVVSPAPGEVAEGPTDASATTADSADAPGGAAETATSRDADIVGTDTSGANTVASSIFGVNQMLMHVMSVAVALGLLAQ